MLSQIGCPFLCCYKLRSLRLSNQAQYARSLEIRASRSNSKLNFMALQVLAADDLGKFRIQLLSDIEKLLNNKQPQDTGGYVVTAYFRSHITNTVQQGAGSLQKIGCYLLLQRRRNRRLLKETKVH